jgi:hypothetical protein
MLLDVELDLASDAAAVAMRAHLESCPRCAARATRERRLTAALAALRVELPVPVDVSEAVARRISHTDPAPARAVSSRQVGWAALAAGLFGIGLLLGIWQLAPDARQMAGQASSAIAGVLQVLAALATPLAGFLTAIARAAGGLLATLASFFEPMQQFGPVAVATIALSTALMTTAIVLVVGRDLARSSWIREGR